MADSLDKPLQERTYDTSRKCLTSRGRSEIAFPPNLRHLEKPTVYEGHQIRPPERTEACRDVRASDAVLGATFDLSGDPVSVDFVSLADQPSLLYTLDQPPTKFDDGAPVDRHRNDSSPHLDRQQGNPTCYATSTTALENQHVYNRPENYRHPKMASYEMRFQTYQDWPHRQPRVVDLVNANMFYEGVFKEAGETICDQVVCYKCGHTFRQWERSDDPTEEHKRIFMGCFEVKWKEEL